MSFGVLFGQTDVHLEPHFLLSLLWKRFIKTVYVIKMTHGKCASRLRAFIHLNKVQIRLEFCYQHPVWTKLWSHTWTHVYLTGIGKMVPLQSAVLKVLVPPWCVQFRRLHCKCGDLSAVNTCSGMYCNTGNWKEFHKPDAKKIDELSVSEQIRAVRPMGKGDHLCFQNMTSGQSVN